MSTSAPGTTSQRDPDSSPSAASGACPGPATPALSRRASLRRLAGGTAALIGAGWLAGCDKMRGDAVNVPAPAASRPPDSVTQASAPARHISHAASEASAGTSPSDGSCSPLPAEQAGLFAADGSAGAHGRHLNILKEPGLLRADIRSSFGQFSGRADGVPLTVSLKLVNTANRCASLRGLVVYLWHCDRDGRFSLYQDPITQQNYLRGTQVSDEAGLASFKTIFPGCHQTRWPHMLFEVFRSEEEATAGARALWVSQLALPQDACKAVYAGEKSYAENVAKLAAASLTTDEAFKDDGGVHQVATVTGSLADGLLATLEAGIALR